MLQLPELLRAGLTEFVEGPDANHRLSFLRHRPHPPVKVRQRSEQTALAFGQQPVDGPSREPFGAHQRHTDGRDALSILRSSSATEDGPRVPADRQVGPARFGDRADVPGTLPFLPAFIGK